MARRWLAGLVLPVVAALSTTLAPSASAASTLPIEPSAPKPVAGVPAPCVSRAAWPAGESLETIRTQMQKQYGLVLVGDWWTKEEYRPVIKVIWQTFDAINCTSYVNDIKAKNKGALVVNAGPISGWAFGDFGLTRPGMVTLDLAKWLPLVNDDPGRLVRLVVHEIGHAYNVDRGEMPRYWREFEQLAAREGRFSDYAGTNVTEIFADVLGYYVARCAKDNPYDKGHQAYYAFAKQVFNDVDFGPAPGEPVTCVAAPDTSTKPTPPPRLLPAWNAPDAARIR